MLESKDNFLSLGTGMKIIGCLKQTFHCSKSMLYSKDFNAPDQWLGDSKGENTMELNLISQKKKKLPYGSNDYYLLEQQRISFSNKDESSD